MPMQERSYSEVPLPLPILEELLLKIEVLFLRPHQEAGNHVEGYPLVPFSQAPYYKQKVLLSSLSFDVTSE